MILAAQHIRTLCIADKVIDPFCERTVANGMSYGLSSCGYDIRIAQPVFIMPGDGVRLASSYEHFSIPDNLLMRIVDKSSWARQGLFVQNTVAEPGWNGYLTLELTNNSHGNIMIEKGTPIAQVIFEQLIAATEQPYRGKYQDQPNYPVSAISELKVSGG